MSNLGVEVVFGDITGKLYLLDLNDLLLFASFFLFLITVKAELAVVHDLAYGRICLSRHQYEVETSVICSVESLRKGNDSELLAVVTDHANALVRSKLDLIVNNMLFSVSGLDGKAPPVNKKCGKELRNSPRKPKPDTPMAHRCTIVLTVKPCCLIGENGDVLLLFTQLVYHKQIHLSRAF